MGYAYLMWIHADAIDQADPEDADWEKLCSAVGRGVLRLTRDVEYFADAGSERRTHHRLGHIGNAINYCDEARSMDRRVYLWSGNRLCPLAKAGNDDVDFAAKEVEQEMLHRMKASE